MNITFGPVYSRRFGWSLGVDLSPQKKQCNFDCVYCELQSAKTMENMEEILPPQCIIESVRQALQNTHCDVLSITANGEPTLYPHLKELITELRAYVPEKVQLLILTNGSLLWKERVREALKLFDIVKFSCDAFDPKIFKKVDRPHHSLSIDVIKAGIREFCSEFQGKIVAEVLLVSGINDGRESAQELASFLASLGALRVDIGSIDRPPAYKVEAIESQKLEELAEYFRIFPHLEVNIPKRSIDSQVGTQMQSYDEASLLGLIKRRPLSKSDASRMFDKQTLALIESMCQKNRIQLCVVGEIEFYMVAE